MYPGMMPILHSPGLMIPGQLGPMRRVLFCSLMIFFTLTCTHAHGVCGCFGLWLTLMRAHASLLSDDIRHHDLTKRDVGKLLPTYPPTYLPIHPRMGNRTMLC